MNRICKSAAAIEDGLFQAIELLRFSDTTWEPAMTMVRTESVALSQFLALFGDLDGEKAAQRVFAWGFARHLPNKSQFLRPVPIGHCARAALVCRFCGRIADDSALSASRQSSFFAKVRSAVRVRDV